MFSKFSKWMFTSFVCFGGFCLVAQDLPVGDVPALRDVPMLAGAAGSIFTGTVTSVRHIPATRENQLETIQITFRVAHALRGAQAGRDLTIREWSGLWTMGERYRVGERVLLFLYPPSKVGLTSPVAGQQGRFAVDDKERVILGQRVAAGDSRVLETVQESGPASETNRDLGRGTRVSYREVFRAARRGVGE
jgi:hypothetical protein